MSNFIKVNTALVRANASIQVANKLLSVNSDLPELIPYRKGDKWGFCDRNKKVVIECIYDKTSIFNEGVASVRLDGKWGVIDKRGKQIANCVYDHIAHFTNGIAEIILKGKWGFINSIGEEIVPCIYDYIKQVSEGLAVAQLHNKYGYVDRTGTQLIPFIYDDADSFTEGLAKIKLNDKYGFINSSGKQIIGCEFEGCGSYSEGLARVKLNGKHGFIDKTGKEIVPIIYDNALDFKEGLAAVKEFNWSFVDKMGKVLLPKYSDYSEYMSEDFFKHGGKNGFIYSSVGCFSEGLAKVSIHVCDDKAVAYCKKHGFEIDVTNWQNKCGFIDKTGKIIVPFIYMSSLTDSLFGDSEIGFSNGLAIVKFSKGWGYDKKYGCLNKTGAEVIPCIYDSIYFFLQGLLFVQFHFGGIGTDNKGIGYIDTNHMQYWEM